MGMTSSVVESIMQPDEPTIKAHLELMFAPLREEYPQGLVEITYGSESPNKAAYFNLHKDGIADATAFAASRSRAGENIYFGVNPRKPGTNLRKRGNDEHVEISIWHFADLDKAESLEGLGKKLRALPPFYTINTGTIPHRRPHLYWLLDEPVRNMAAWTQRQSGLASALIGDRVINPSRIMRLAGTVNFPPQHKVQRGYRVELVTLKTEFEDEREAVSPDLVAAAFPAITRADTAVSAVLAPVPQGMNTLQAMRSTHLHDLLDACRSGQEWHNNMIRLVAHLAAKGRGNAEIMAIADHITLPGYTVAQTQRDMMTALQSARAKWALPEPEDTPLEQEEAERDAALNISTVDAFDFDESAIPPRPWMIPGVMLRGYTHMLVAPGGSGKSLFTLQLAIAMATGDQWGEWTPRKRFRSLVINVEDDLHEQRRRLAAARRVMEPDAEKLRGMIHLTDDTQSIVVAKMDPHSKSVVATPLVAGLRKFIEQHKIDALIVDPFAETFEGDENSNSEIKWAMKVWRDEIARPCNCAVYLVHHTTKYANGGAGDANIIRGAGAIVNSTRIAATLMPMTAEEAQALGIEPEQRNRYVRYDDAKANQSLVSGRGHWFEKVSVEIANGTALEQPDEVGALKPWTPPDAFSGLGTQSLRMAAERINRGLEDDNGHPTGERYALRKGGQTDRRWAGKVLVECLGVEPLRAANILKTWQRNGLLEEVPYDDPVQRKSRNGVVVDMQKVAQIGGAM
jgi:hypothetical protein